jgi:hypothetical protein
LLRRSREERKRGDCARGSDDVTSSSAERPLGQIPRRSAIRFGRKLMRSLRRTTVKVTDEHAAVGVISSVTAVATDATRCEPSQRAAKPRSRQLAKSARVRGRLRTDANRRETWLRNPIPSEAHSHPLVEVGWAAVSGRRAAPRLGTNPWLPASWNSCSRRLATCPMSDPRESASRLKTKCEIPRESASRLTTKCEIPRESASR